MRLHEVKEDGKKVLPRMRESVAWAEKSKRDVANQLVSLALGGVNGQTM